MHTSITNNKNPVNFNLQDVTNSCIDEDFFLPRLPSLVSTLEKLHQMIGHTIRYLLANDLHSNALKHPSLYKFYQKCRSSSQDHGFAM